MTESLVAGIRKGADDASGAHIVSVYAKVPGFYAVYRTQERVIVAFADDPSIAAAQRRALLPLLPLQGEINGLVDGWRSSEVSRSRSKANLFDRRVADATVTALEGHPGIGAALLSSILRDLIEERTSKARVQYLIAAASTAAVLIALFSLLTTPFWREIGYAFEPQTETLWLAAAMGALGAFFSIAIAIRKRTVLTDLQFRDNVADAVLRIAIGVIGAALVICLLSSGVVTLAVGTGSVTIGKGYSWLLVVVVAFVAGFSERLVSDLLERSASTLVGDPAPAPPGATAPTVEGPPSPLPAGVTKRDIAAAAGGAASDDAVAEVFGLDGEDPYDAEPAAPAKAPEKPADPAAAAREPAPDAAA